MKRVTVLGATGGVGYALTKELLSRGVHVNAFARNESKLSAMFGIEQNAEIFIGDALDESDIRRAVAQADAVYHALNFPYSEWEVKQLHCIDLLIKVAKEENKKLILADNIYGYGNKSMHVSEETVKQPNTKKGKIRLQMEQRLFQSGLPVLIVHLPDLYGPYAENTLIHETLRLAIQSKKANYIGCATQHREYLFTMDAAKAITDLSLQDDCYNQNWNVSGSVIKGETLLAHIRTETNTTKGFRIVKRPMIRFLGLFSKQMKELVEMMYLMETPVYLDSSKLRHYFGGWEPTPYEIGVRETILWLKHELK
ncbi:SDR family NAD(P)-dependent oxidoreductase [Shouchella sp. JSM 1781072]|uniref:SDR family NAD(P)-dependent oxidoreductase n=1 Tax=Shouchella sp. JSM 1781072 TaxID=3344581 RepID=UPI0035C042A2